MLELIDQTERDTPQNLQPVVDHTQTSPDGQLSAWLGQLHIPPKCVPAMPAQASAITSIWQTVVCGCTGDWFSVCSMQCKKHKPMLKKPPETGSTADV